MSLPIDPHLQADYRALRQTVAAHAYDRDVLLVRGPEARTFLQGQCSQDVESLGTGDVRDAFVLEPTGRLVALVRVLCVDDDTFVLDTDAGFGDAVVERLARFRLRTKVEIERVRWHAVAVRGPGASSALDLPEAAPEVPNGPTRAVEVGGDWIVPVSWNGIVGFDLLGPNARRLVAAGARWCGPGAWEALRVEAGLPAMGRELDSTTVPAETGLLSRAVSFTKGCYTGQELVARMDARGNHAPRVLAGVEPTDRTVVPATLVGAELSADPDGKPLGECTSAAWCPGLGAPAGLARVHRTLPVPGAVWIRRAGGPPEEGRLVNVPLVDA